MKRFIYFHLNGKRTAYLVTFAKILKYAFSIKSFSSIWEKGSFR